MGNPSNQPKILYKFTLKSLILCVLIVLLALGGSYWFGYSRAMVWTRKLITSITPVRENNKEYSYIYPLLMYNFGEANQFFEDKTLEQKINDYLKSKGSDQNAESISVSFRGFSQRKWAGVNQNVQYHPGSMMKVIIMMGYFREAEQNPDILNKTFVFSQDVAKQTNDVAFSLSTGLEVGKSYTVSYLLKDMIGNSDNGAETLLLNNIKTDVLNQVYVDLSLPIPDNAGNDYTISTSQYSDFLRILYNSTYLTEQYSEQALSIMSQSAYKDGITAGVPQDIQVAQKYGERVDSTNNSVDGVELHDCGIVYAPNGAYALCIMTKSKTTANAGAADEKKLAGITKDISKLVYDYEEAK